MTEQIHFSDNDHWRFGWGKKLYNFYEPTLPMWVTFGPCRRSPQTFNQEIAEAVKRIANNIDKPIYIAMSGGIDSELVARTMIQEKVEFKPVIVQFEHDYNKEDISYAFEFCNSHKLTPEIVKLDILAFFNSCLKTNYASTNCAHLLQMHIMRHVHRLGGATVICGGEQRYENIDGKIFIPVHSARMAVCHFMQLEQIKSVSNFYCYTAEMMLSLLLESKNIGFDNMSKYSHNVKEAIYHKYWPDIKARPKYSGFEAVAEHRLFTQKKLRHKMLQKYGSDVTHICKIPIEELENQLTGALSYPCQN